MYIQFKMMGGVVYEEFFISWGFFVLIFDICFVEQFQLEQFVFYYFVYFFMIIFQYSVGQQYLLSVFYVMQYSIVYFVLLFCKVFVNRYSMVQIGSVVGIFCIKIQEQQVVVYIVLVVLNVVEYVGVFVIGYNWFIGVALGIVVDKFCDDFCFYFVFYYIRVDKIQYFFKGFVGDIYCVVDKFDFCSRFDYCLFFE